MSDKNVISFSAGPAKLPKQVLLQVQRELLSYKDTGISILEMSHRSAKFMEIVNDAQVTVRKLLNVPLNYKILFMAAGGTGQFAAVPLNLISKTGKACYIVTGTWSTKAVKEASKFGEIQQIKPNINNLSNENWKIDQDVSYVYYCDNETVDGVEFHYVPEVESSIPIVADMSSNILTKYFDVSKFGLIFAGAQKNIGPAGVTLVIVREDLLGSALPNCPTVLNYSIMAADNSLHNTPPCFSLYVMGLVFEWIAEKGGVKSMEDISARKSTMVYDLIKESNGFYTCVVPESCRSRVNIPFRIKGGNEELENQFIKQAKDRDLLELKGHRSVGGIRASLYNAISVEEVTILVTFMKDFMYQLQ